MDFVPTSRVSCAVVSVPGPDARAWLAVMRPLSSHLDAVVDFTGSQLLRMPRHPVTTVRFGLRDPTAWRPRRGGLTPVRSRR